MSKYTTEQRRILSEYFATHYHKAFTVKELATALEPQGISISAIYRNLPEMENDGLLLKVSKQEGAVKHIAYQFIDPVKCAGVIHLVCEKCSDVHHVNKNITDLLVNMAQENCNFLVQSQKSVLYGLCQNCAKGIK